VVLVINVATHDAKNAKENFEALQALHSSYGSKGLVILAVPSNQVRSLSGCLVD
jgi:glutathione peroxidase-family protein